MQSKLKLSAGSNRQTFSAENDLAQSESALAADEAAYKKARVEVRRTTGSILKDYGTSIADAESGAPSDGYSSLEPKSGAMEAGHLE
jgi:hypothetical protein